MNESHHQTLSLDTQYILFSVSGKVTIINAFCSTVWISTHFISASDPTISTIGYISDRDQCHFGQKNYIITATADTCY